MSDFSDVLKSLGSIKTEDRGYTSECWIWQRGLNNYGYGKVWIDGEYLLAHRVVYELLEAQIEDGMKLDHLCRVHKCVNPSHLEPVTNKENLNRGNGASQIAHRNGVCVKGLHEMTGHNKMKAVRGSRCRACYNEWQRIQRGKK